MRSSLTFAWIGLSLLGGCNTLSEAKSLTDALTTATDTTSKVTKTSKELSDLIPQSPPAKSYTRPAMPIVVGSASANWPVREDVKTLFRDILGIVDRRTQDAVSNTGWITPRERTATGRSYDTVEDFAGDYAGYLLVSDLDYFTVIDGGKDTLSVGTAHDTAHADARSSRVICQVSVALKKLDGRDLLSYATGTGTYDSKTNESVSVRAVIDAVRVSNDHQPGTPTASQDVLQEVLDQAIAGAVAKLLRNADAKRILTEELQPTK